MAQKQAKTKQIKAEPHHTEVSCKVAKGLIQYIENHGDPVQTKKFLEEIEDERHLLDHDYHWMSYSKLSKILKSAKRVTENKNAATRIGEHVMQKEVLDSLHHVIKSHQNSHQAIKNLPDFISHFHQTGELEVAHVGQGSAEIHFSYH